MKNFPVKVDNKEYWVSRAMAVVAMVFAKDIHGRKHVLTVQRGIGTPDPEYIGKYCLPCGYLDFDETLIQAVARELKEETGVTLPNSDFKLLSFSDDPKADKRQNVTFKYVVESNVPVEDIQKVFTSANSEKDEVSDIRFIPIEDLSLYEWAFHHNKIIELYIAKHDIFNSRH